MHVCTFTCVHVHVHAVHELVFMKVGLESMRTVEAACNRFRCLHIVAQAVQVGVVRRVGMQCGIVRAPLGVDVRVDGCRGAEGGQECVQVARRAAGVRLVRKFLCRLRNKVVLSAPLCQL